jgi:hypothetical protein
MLTAVVVTADDNLPGEGFFNLAKGLGLQADDKLAFWSRQLNNVYGVWKERSAGG